LPAGSEHADLTGSAELFRASPPEMEGRPAWN
jgi:hypothetical protein